MTRLILLLESMSGAHPLRLTGRLGWIGLGIWWAILFLLVYVTIGRSTKFIYVDF